MTAMSASKSFIAAFVGVPAQLTDASTDFSIKRPMTEETKVPINLPLVQSCPDTIKTFI